MRDNLILALVFASLPLIVYRPFFGLGVYSWLAYMRPQDMAWGATKVLPLSQWVAIAMAIGIVIAVAFGQERLLKISPQTICLILLGLWISLSTLNAVVPELSQQIYGIYWKAIVVSLLTTGMVRDRRRLRILLLLIAFSIGFLGVKRGIFGMLRGGTRYDDGPGGFMSDNNSFALALNMVLPLLAGFVQVEKERLIRIAAAVAVFFSVLSIVFTFSRGGFLTLVLVGGLLIWRSQRRVLVAGVLALGLVGLLFLSSGRLMQAYMDRASSISDYQEDGSAQGRLIAWKVSWQVFLDHPLVGVGPNNFQAVFFRYAPIDRFHVSHNAYFQLLAECGLPALLLFLAAIGVSYRSLQRLRRTTPDPWIETHARMIQISILGYLLGSMFLNTAYSELIYHLLAFSVCLGVVSRAMAAEPGEAPAPGESAESTADMPWWKKPPRRPAPAAAPTWTGGEA